MADNINITRNATQKKVRQKKFLAIIGSTRADSSNLKLVKKLQELTTVELILFDKIAELPHFNPDLEDEFLPKQINDFRQLIIESDSVIICTPEYVFSLPGSLKNAIEWCVSTTIFSHKPVGLITAAASGDKAHEELQLVMKTIEAKFLPSTTLLIKGIKGKFDAGGNLIDNEVSDRLKDFLKALENLIDEKKQSLSPKK